MWASCEHHVSIMWASCEHHVGIMWAMFIDLKLQSHDQSWDIWFLKGHMIFTSSDSCILFLWLQIPHRGSVLCLCWPGKWEPRFLRLVSHKRKCQLCTPHGLWGAAPGSHVLCAHIPGALHNGRVTTTSTIYPHQRSPQQPIIHIESVEKHICCCCSLAALYQTGSYVYSVVLVECRLSLR